MSENYITVERIFSFTCHHACLSLGKASQELEPHRYSEDFLLSKLLSQSLSIQRSQNQTFASVDTGSGHLALAHRLCNNNKKNNLNTLGSGVKFQCSVVAEIANFEKMVLKSTNGGNERTIDRSIVVGTAPEMRCHIFLCEGGFSWESEINLP